MKIKTVISCDHSEIEEIIQKEYGHSYEIMPMEEVGSSQYAATYNITITNKQKLDEGEAEDIESLKQGKPEQFILRTIFQDLVNNDKLTVGEYIIDVSW